MTCVVPPGWAWLLSGIFLAAAGSPGRAGRSQDGDILCQPSGTMILKSLDCLAVWGQAADEVTAARARFRLAAWTASS